MSERRNTGKSFITLLTRKNETKMKALIDEGLTWMVIQSDTHVYEVEGGESSHSFNLEARTCTCLRWRVYGFPCAYAFASITMSGSNPNDFIEPYFTTEYFKMPTTMQFILF
ncbi:uncharacterized protein LOC113335213 [Papaver somniferum]|uniref:uncharacterized protein LOC113335213 n=1 Tax=Papaver somniferum TaxID=3469 RepID=UPI000E6FB193|nr:uncharacterized protein LOC113335213 [Papaver somniferum]